MFYQSREEHQETREVAKRVQMVLNEEKIAMQTKLVKITIVNHIEFIINIFISCLTIEVAMFRLLLLVFIRRLCRLGGFSVIYLSSVRLYCYWAVL